MRKLIEQVEKQAWPACVVFRYTLERKNKEIKLNIAVLYVKIMLNRDDGPEQTATFMSIYLSICAVDEAAIRQTNRISSFTVEYRMVDA